MNAKQEIIKSFWEFAEILRDWLPHEAAAECPACLFFVKRLTDLAAAGRANEIPAESPEFLISQFRNFSWSKLASESSAGTALWEVLQSIEDSVPQLGGLSRESPLSQILATRDVIDVELRAIFSSLGRISTDELTSEEAADVFQQLLDAMGDRAAISGTPPSIRKLLVALVDPKPTDTIYDPVCGFASLLCDAAAYTKGGPAKTLAGQDINRHALLLAQMNILLHGARPDLRLGNTLIAPQHREGAKLQKFDVILANPPFGLKLQASQIFDHVRFLVAPLSSESGFVQHIIQSLAPTGRAAVLVPNGILSRAGGDHHLRKNLIDRGQVEAVVRLPPYLFSGTAIAVSVLVLRGEMVLGHRQETVFVDLSGHAEGPTTRRHLNDSGILEGSRCVREHVDKDGFSSVVTSSEIAANEFNLSVGRYVRVANDHGLLPFEEELRALLVAIDNRNHLESKAMDMVNEAKRHSAWIAKKEVAND